MVSTTEIGQRLKAFREDIGLSQADFAEIAGMTKQAQINYESGRRTPDAQYLGTLAQKTEMDVNYILTGKRCKLSDQDFHMISKIDRLSPQIKQAVMVLIDHGSEQG